MIRSRQTGRDKPVAGSDREAFQIVLAGACALALAMGIGRFAYTPMLPIMLESGGPALVGGGLTLAGAGFVASANFLGYLSGALLATRSVFAAARIRWLRAGIVLSILTTAAMAIDAGTAGWAALRFAAGLASAFVLVYATGMIFDLAARTGRPMLGNLLYSGAGMGIALSAVAVFAGRSTGLDATAMWLMMGILAALLAIAPWRKMSVAANAAAAPTRRESPPAGAERAMPRLVVAYGCLGLGYVITATFIVVMVRRLPDASTWEFWTWLTVGLAGAPSNWLWARVAARIGAYRAIVIAFVLEAIGVALAALGSGPIAILIGAALLGGTFLGITALGLAAARALAPEGSDQTIARMTVAFSIGQIIGPAIGGWLAERSGSFVAASWLAVTALLAGAALTASAGRELRRASSDRPAAW